MKYQTYELKKKIHVQWSQKVFAYVLIFQTFFVLSDFYIAFVIIKKLSGISFLIQVNMKYLHYYHFYEI